MDSLSSYAKDLPKNDKALFELSQYPLLDVEEGIRISGSQETFNQLLAFMVTEQVVLKDLEKMQVAHAVQDWQSIQELAHKIKGGAMYIGATKMKIACQYLERYWKVGQRDALEKLYQQAVQVIEETQQAVIAAREK